jgi:hypothetical protein
VKAIEEGRDPAARVEIAAVHALRGERDVAIRWLRQAYDAAPLPPPEAPRRCAVRLGSGVCLLQTREYFRCQRFGNGGGRMEIVTDERILGRSVQQSWVTQQHVKLNAHKLRFADVWIVVDSDFVFLRQFGIRDLIDEAGRPRFVNYSPWEAFWVGEWAVATGVGVESPVEPYFLHFDTRFDLIDLWESELGGDWYRRAAGAATVRKRPPSRLGARTGGAARADGL